MPEIEQIFIKPAKAETKVPMPGKVRQYLPVTGAWVPDNSYWRRRLGDEDVVMAPAPTPQAKKAKPAAKPTTQEDK
jgi:hypothetical protein